MLATMHHTETVRPGLRHRRCADRPAIGRPKSATYRTADVVGLDTMAHVIKTMADTLPDDPWHRTSRRPAGCRRWSPRARSARRPAPASTRRAARTSSARPAKHDYVPGGEKPTRRRRILKEPGAEKFAAARERAIRRRSSCGPAPRPVPLQRLSPGVDRRHRARRRLRDPLGLRLDARPVRDLAGRRLEAGRRVDRRRHRRRQGDERRAAAGLGVRRPQRRARRRRALRPARKTQVPPARCRCTHASASPIPCSAEEFHSARQRHRCSRTTAAHVDADGDVAIAVAQDQAAHRQRRR